MEPRLTGVHTGAAAALTLAGSAAAQCPGTWEAAGPVPGVVQAMATWDPDGPGPGPERLVVGGQFTSVAGVPASNVAEWDGETWRPLGAGFPAQVYALASFQGSVVASASQQGGVQRWSGTEWAPLGTLPQWFSAGSFAEFQGDLVAGGGKIFRFNGSTWTAMPTGMPEWDTGALREYRGSLYGGGYGGYFAALLRWTPPDWSLLQIFTSQSTYVRSFAEYDRLLIGGGDFSGALFAYDGGSFSGLGPGYPLGVSGRCYTVAAYNGQLIAGGVFTTAGGRPASNIAAWDGAQWSPLGSGVSSGILNPVRSLAAFRGKLAVGGAFTTAGGLPSQGLAFWTSAAPGCYANCDCSTAPPVLNVNDYVCFLNQFSAGSTRANCDNSTGQPVLNVSDFVCFLNRFAAGCG